MYQNMILSPVVYLLLGIVLSPCISALEEPKGIALYERNTTPAPSQSTETYTTTSSSSLPSTTISPPNEILEAVNITIDGQLFPPPIQIEGLTTTT